MALTLAQCWLVLLGCIASEVTGSICLKLSNHYQNILPSILMFVFFILAFVGFPFALWQIDLGTAYAVWSGVGTAATAAIGIAYFHEKATLLKIVGVGVIIVGVIMLNIAEASEEGDSTIAEKENGMGDATERTTLVQDASSSQYTI